MSTFLSPPQPQELTAEYALAAGVLNDPTLILSHGSLLDPSDFSHPLCALLWRWAKEAASEGRELDIVTVTERHKERLDAHGGLESLLAIYRGFYAAASVPEYVRLVREHAAKRRLKRLADSILTRLDAPESSVAEIAADVERAAWTVRPAGDETHNAERRVQNVLDWMDRLERRAKNGATLTGVPTGWRDLDRLTMGWQEGDLITVGARTSMGKSVFGLEAFIRAQEHGKKAAYLSLEMSREQIYNRSAARLGRIDAQRLRSGQITDSEWLTVTRIAETLSSYRVLDDRTLSTADIAAAMRRLKYTDGLDFVVVDYAQNVQEPTLPGDISGQRIGRVAHALREAAAQSECAVMLLSQVSRTVEARSNKRPTLSDLSESSHLENESDVVILLYRDAYYNPESDEKNVMEIHVAKQRNGPTGLVKLAYLGEYQALHNLERGQDR